MPANLLGCTHCGAHLKAPAGKARVRCPRCGTVLTVPPGASGSAPAAEEPIDYLEDVEESPVRPRRPRHDEDFRPPRRLRRRSRHAGSEYLWLIAVGAAAASFVIGFGISFADMGMQGLPADQNGNYALKVGALAFGVLVALIFVGMGVLAVKTRTIYLRGQVTTGAARRRAGLFLHRPRRRARRLHGVRGAAGSHPRALMRAAGNSSGRLAGARMKR